MSDNRPQVSPLETPSAPQVTEKPPARSRTVTLRAVSIGLLMVAVIVGMTQMLSIRYSAAEVGGHAPPPAPTYLLFLYVLLVAPLLTRLNRRLALSRGELLLIYAMMLIAGPITHPYAIGFLVPHAATPLYFDTLEPRWADFKPYIPAWFGPANRGAAQDLFQGTGGVVPWGAWLLPLLAWSSLLIVLFFMTLCINVIMRRQWVENERLVFPLAALPLALTDQAETSLFGHPARILRDRLFWLGLALALLLQAPNSLHHYFPALPALPLQNVILLNGSTLTPPWNGLGDIEFDLIFWLVGLAYLVPKEIALSAWVFYFIARLEDVAAVAFGVSGEAPSVNGNDFPALRSQGVGAVCALTFVMLYTARHHLRDVLRKAFRRDPTVNDSGEFLSYRVAVLGIPLGGAFILAWCWLAGMRLWVAGLLFGFMFLYFFIFARIRAETGLGMGSIFWPKSLEEVVMTLVGAKYLTMADLTLLHAMRWVYYSTAMNSVMAAQTEGIKLVDASGLRGRRIGWTLALAATVTVPLAFLWTLKTYYAQGFINLPIGRESESMVASQIHWAYNSIMYHADAAQGPELGGILAMGAGALVTVAMSWMRMRFLWFPLHPVGYLAANSWGMHIHWVSFLLGWLLKTLITRYGGMKGYQRLLPIFLGLIVGDMLHEGLWGMVAWITGSRGQEA